MIAKLVTFNPLMFWPVRNANTTVKPVQIIIHVLHALVPIDWRFQDVDVQLSFLMMGQMRTVLHVTIHVPLVFNSQLVILVTV